MKKECNFKMKPSKTYPKYFCALKNPDLAHGILPYCDSEDNCILLSLLGKKKLEVKPILGAFNEHYYCLNCGWHVCSTRECDICKPHKEAGRKKFWKKVENR